MYAGRQSVKLDKEIYVENVASVVGKKEGEGPLGNKFDIVCMDYMMGKKNWEEAESELQCKTVEKLFMKANVKPEDIRCIFGGDLLGQLIATSFGLKRYEIPLYGIYGACSTFGEALALGSTMLNANKDCDGRVIAIASSHFASAEKQFRFPLEYGNQRPLASTWTVTGCGATILNTQKTGNGPQVVVSGYTTGKIVDYGVKDSMNMGSCMAPAVADLLLANFKDFNVDEKYYDVIITGDLGRIGRTIVTDLMAEKGHDLTGKFLDCGIEIYNPEVQNTMSGGSGCGCSAVTFCAYIYENILSGKWNRVLFIPTGALLSTVSYNEGKSVPGIAHGVVLERR